MPLVGCCYLLLDEPSAERSETTGQFLVEPQFEIAWSFSEGVVAVDKKSKFGCLNTATQLVIPHQFPFFR
ncbi:MULTISPECIES: WG repeat-containing protein [unclassified Microcoleus]|uniref:WG repeat-containing protein n=1 Tax=unclassified Microcoleus TaxID=2642155 RepID=UPI004040C83A